MRRRSDYTAELSNLLTDEFHLPGNDPDKVAIIFWAALDAAVEVIDQDGSVAQMKAAALLAAQARKAETIENNEEQGIASDPQIAKIDAAITRVEQVFAHEEPFNRPTNNR